MSERNFSRLGMVQKKKASVKKHGDNNSNCEKFIPIHFELVLTKFSIKKNQIKVHLSFIQNFNSQNYFIF